MAKYFKFIGDEKIVMSFQIREDILTAKGWTKLVEPEPTPKALPIVETEEQTEPTEEAPKPKRKYTKRTKTNS
jgi:hypothetical protein